ncbi:unnamed protein product [Toxocara canis]|uniref:TAXi_C domain-containing protein n=1 Tax=Toxocara canis TaxID=6265 RepID=A0A183V6G2_TOXCA|nr:unnamed protein product [Toxocara canis]
MLLGFLKSLEVVARPLVKMFERVVDRMMEKKGYRKSAVDPIAVVVTPAHLLSSEWPMGCLGNDMLVYRHSIAESLLPPELLSFHRHYQMAFIGEGLNLIADVTISKVSQGQRIEIGNQEGGDIKQPQDEGNNVWLMLNALSSHSPFKWDRINTTDVLYRIPYVINGLYVFSK